MKNVSMNLQEPDSYFNDLYHIKSITPNSKRYKHTQGIYKYKLEITQILISDTSN